MPRIPVPVGAGEFAPQWRVDKAHQEIGRLLGRGGYSDEPASVVLRTFGQVARVDAGVSLATERLRNQIFADTLLEEDLLCNWEQSLRVRDPRGSLEQRRERIGEMLADKGAPTGIAIKQKLERIVGAGNARYLFNTAVLLDALGQSRLGIYQIGFEVPAAFISTPGDHQRLLDLVTLYKPTHCGAAVGRSIQLKGFLCDDPESLTDRDMLRI
jgi:hypothetical protein